MSNSGEVVRYFVMSVILIRNSDGKSLEYDETFSHFTSHLLRYYTFENIKMWMSKMLVISQVVKNTTILFPECGYQVFNKIQSVPILILK